MLYQAHQMSELTQGQLVSLSLDDLAPDSIRIKIHYSALNYKDALALTGQGKILRHFPLVPGIDAVGEVVETNSSLFQVGERVTVNGQGIGESLDGAYAEYMQVKAELATLIPPMFSYSQAATMGTAGITAALCVQRLLQNGQTPKQGPIVVTGASGGVGSFATAILSKLGFDVIAVSSKRECYDWLKALGALQIMSIDELKLGHRPLESARYAGAIDSVGGDTLAHLLAHIQPWGNVAAIGLASGMQLNMTVMPFILRGVSLLGVTAANCSSNMRSNVWRLLSGDYLPDSLELLHDKTISLSQITQAAQAMLNRQTHARTLVSIF